MPPSMETTRRIGMVGAASNWLIPIAGFNNVYSLRSCHVDPVMTSVLLVYSTVFFRWALAIAPANYPLAACHVANFTAQSMLLGKHFFCDGDETTATSSTSTATASATDKK